jgi:hypothetical protein
LGWITLIKNLAVASESSSGEVINQTEIVSIGDRIEMKKK